MTHYGFPFLLLSLISSVTFVVFIPCGLGVCLHMHVPMCLQTHAPVHAWIEAGGDMGCLPRSLRTLFFELKSLTDPRARHFGEPGYSECLESTCYLCPLSCVLPCLVLTHINLSVLYVDGSPACMSVCLSAHHCHAVPFEDCSYYRWS